MATHALRYGRLLSDFEVGATYAHPWDVTVDAGTIALFQASFLDAMPTFASREYARALGLADRPVHPLLCLNLGLSFSVHDVSEQAIAHLAYIDVRFPAPLYPGATVTATSRVLDVRPSKSGDRGVVHVRTALTDEHGTNVCVFQRKALVRAGTLASRPLATPRVVAGKVAAGEDDAVARIPPALATALPSPPTRGGGFAGRFEDFVPGDVYFHQVGKTVGESEHMQLTALVRNSHPLHFDEQYAKGSSFAGTRVVYGGLVLSWACALASRDVAGNAAWELGLDDGAHPAGVVAGDTLYAASKVLTTKAVDAHWGEVTFRLVATKNALPADIVATGKDLFAAELGKADDARVAEKVVEITRTLLVARVS